MINHKSIKFLKEYLNEPMARFGVILGVTLIISSVVIGLAVSGISNKNNTLTVTGSATKIVKADTVKWTIEIMRTTKLSSLNQGYVQLSRDLDIAKRFFLDNGYSADRLEISTVSMFQNYENIPYGVEKDYTLSQTITITSNQEQDLVKITELSKNIGNLVSRGVIASTRSLEYLYSKLPEERVALLGEATADAKNRAVQIAKPVRGKVGSLVGASAGVVQVRPLNSVDVSDYGAYDTSNIDKQIMVTVKATFKIK